MDTGALKEFPKFSWTFTFAVDIIFEKNACRNNCPRKVLASLKIFGCFLIYLTAHSMLSQVQNG